MMTDSKQRFTSRVTDYIAGRPTYPKALVDLLAQRIGFGADWSVVDVGAGTGISTKLFLDNGNAVTAIEPNDAMRGAADEMLTGYPKYRSLSAPAESLPLADGSVDLILAAQAFHWFDPVRFATESRRLLSPRGRVALVWNTPLPEATSAALAYQTIIRKHAEQHELVANKWRESDLLARTWFEPATYFTVDLQNDQTYAMDDLIARVASSSYMPQRGQPNFDPMLEDLRALHAEYQVNGRMTLPYVCRVFCGVPKGGTS